MAATMVAPRHVGMLGIDKATRWRKVTKKTLVELIVSGHITQSEAARMIEEKSIKPLALRNAIWREVKAQITTDAQMDMIKRLYPLLQYIKAL